MDQEILKKKDIIRFIGKLSSENSVEGLLKLLYKEVAKFKKIENIFLLHWSYDYSLRIAYTQSKSIKLIQAQQRWSSSLRLGINEIEDSQYLAEAIKRPVGKLIKVPFQANQVLRNRDSLPIILYFEHDLAKEKIEEFIDFLDSRLNLLNISLEKIFLENHLKNTSLLWGNTFNALKDPVLIVDGEYKVLKSNDEFSSLKNKTQCYEKFAQLDNPCEGCLMQESLETGEMRKARIKKKDKIYDVYSFPILLGGHRAKTVVNHYIDVTHAYELQGEMIQNEKMSAIGTFAGNIAHELNNPLTGLRSLVQVLISETNEELELYGDLKEIEQAAERSQNIIKSLLDFSTADKSQNKEEISLSALVQATLPLLKSTIHEFNYRIEHSDRDKDNVYVVPDLLRQVIFNIINNACQATSKGGDIILITEVKGSQARLNLQDSGHGMSEEVIKKIFEPFFTTKKKGQGTGLGLSMSREIVESFDGTISVESEIGEGTSFMISLPLSKI